MSTLDNVQRGSLFPSVHQHLNKMPGYTLTRSLSYADLLPSPSAASRPKNKTMSTSVTSATPPLPPTTILNRNNSNNGSTISVTTQPPLTSLSGASYRRLGMPRSELPEFMKVDLDAHVHDIKLDTLPDRMKILDIFMANFATQFQRPKSPPASRSVTAQTPEPQPPKRSITDLDEFIESRIFASETSQTPKGKKHPKQNHVSKALNNGNGNRPTDSFIRSKTFDSSFINSNSNSDNGANFDPVAQSPSLAAAIITLTKKEKGIPLTFSGDVRAPTPALSLNRDIPELWSTVGLDFQTNISPTPGSPSLSRENTSPIEKPTGTIQLLSSSTFKWQHDSSSDNSHPVNVQRLLEANKPKFRQPLDNKTSSTNRLSASHLPVQTTNNAEATEHSPRKEPTNNDSKSWNKAIAINQSQLIRNDSSFLPVREKSTKTVRFRLDEDVHVFSPWSGSPPPPAADGLHSNKSNETADKSMASNNAPVSNSEAQ